ncbi:uncharacterized protein [Leptinotarsa decemlineata]|uniref:uncharacterized protein n=1 Tax=Leptinotarsa decemlineata TaxID=7539 RepID=UPI003D30D720
MHFGGIHIECSEFDKVNDSKTLSHTYKTYIKPIMDYKVMIYCAIPPRLTHRSLTTQRSTLRNIHNLPYRFPTNDIHNTVKLTPINLRFQELRGKYITRTIRSSNTTAIETLATPWTPRGDPRRIPKKKLPFSPARLLGALEDIPEQFQEEFPLAISFQIPCIGQ